MKKVAIVTIESINFGNRLQNYALQQVLCATGCSVQTLHRIPPKTEFKSRCKYVFQNMFQTKAAKFRQFDKNINFSKCVVGRDYYPETLNDEFDLFVSGSDQVWNPYYDFTAGSVDFLTFASMEKRIAYAPSFGVSRIPEERREEYSQWLKNFAFLSVREETGAEIIKELTGRIVPVVLDPTLMLSAAEWEQVMRPSKWVPKENYVFVYALGEKSDVFKTAINYYGKNMTVFDIRQKQKNGREIPIGPAEFLYAIHNATVVLTDSFHCSVFSLIFDCPVYTFDRPGISMSSRIQTLHQSLGVKQNDYRNIQIDNKVVQMNIRRLQKESMNYILQAVQGGVEEKE